MIVVLTFCASFALAFALLRQVSLPVALRRWLEVLSTIALASACKTISLLWHAPPGILVLLLGASAAAAYAAWPGVPEIIQRISPAAARWTKAVFYAAAAASAAAVLLHFFKFPDGGNDAFIIWNLRARWLFKLQGDVRSAFSPEILFWTHQDYPLLVPGAVIQGFELLQGDNRVVPAVIAVLFAACAVGIVVSSAAVDQRWIAGLALVTTPAVVMQAAAEQADLPLAALVAAATSILLLRRRGDLRSLAAAGAFASMAAWTKNEGSLHLVLLGTAVILDERRLKSLLAFLIGALPFLVLLAGFKFQFAPRNDLLQATIANALQHALTLDRWWTLALLIVRRIVLLQAWGLHLLVLAVWIAFGRKRTVAPANARWLSWMPAATLAAHLGILLAQPHDVTFMFKVTIDRLVLQLWPAILLLVSSRRANGPGVEPIPASTSG